MASKSKLVLKLFRKKIENKKVRNQRKDDSNIKFNQHHIDEDLSPVLNISTDDSKKSKVQKLHRKRKAAQPENWEVNKIQKLKPDGLFCTLKKGAIKSPKRSKYIECCKCIFECSSKIDKLQSRKICRSFWKLNNCLQKDFILKCVTENVKKRQNVEDTPKKGKATRKYFLSGFRVCKQFFLNTLAISNADKVFASIGNAEISGSQDVARGSDASKNYFRDDIRRKNDDAKINDPIDTTLPSTNKVPEKETVDDGISQSQNISTYDSDKIMVQKSNRKRRVLNPENWEVNINKKRRSEGLSYTSKSGVKRPPKQPKSVDCSECIFECNSKINESKRSEICRSFWKLDNCHQKDFILKCVTENVEKRHNVEDTKKGKASRKYFLSGFRVCKTFFLKTLSISHGPVDTALAHSDETRVFKSQDRRGRHPPKHKIPNDVIETIKSHIESFPTKSHCCEKDSQKKYLDSELSVRKMYDLFLDSLPKTKNFTIPSETTYRRYFRKNYNLSFFDPKKDNCSHCEHLKDAKK